MNVKTVEEFINKANIIAIIGASSNPDKWGYKIYKKLKMAGFKAIPVNSKGEIVDDDESFKDLKSIPDKPGVVITVVPPKVTEEIVKICAELEINKIWMLPGSESPEAIKFCEDNGLNVIHHACFVVDGMHDSF